MPENGQLPFPSDYYNLIDLGAYEPESFAEAMEGCSKSGQSPNYDEIEQISVIVLDNNQLKLRLSSPNFKPTLDLPVATLFQSYIQFYPINIGTITMDYMQKPATPFWNSTLNAKGVPVYNPIGSTDFNWSEIMTNQLISRICRLAGIEFRESDLIGSSQAIEQPA